MCALRALGLFRNSLKNITAARGRIVYGRLRNDAFREKADGKNDSSQLFCQKLFCRSARIAATLLLGHSCHLPLSSPCRHPFHSRMHLLKRALRPEALEAFGLAEKSSPPSGASFAARSSSTLALVESKAQRPLPTTPSSHWYRSWFC